MRPSPRRLLKIAIRSRRNRLLKSADFGGASSPCGQAVFRCKILFVQQKTQLAICLLQIRWLSPSFSRHGRAVLARLCSFGLSKTFRPLVGRTIEPAAVKTGKVAPIPRRNRYSGKDTDRFDLLYNIELCRKWPLRWHKQQRIETDTRRSDIR